MTYPLERPPHDLPGDFAVIRSHGELLRWGGFTWRWEASRPWRWRYVGPDLRATPEAPVIEG